jgi:FKBP-type peptidyl-prolyl cis-trans isomerase FklB
VFLFLNFFNKVFAMIRSKWIAILVVGALAAHAQSVQKKGTTSPSIQVQKKGTAPQPAPTGVRLSDFADSLSYALGMNMIQMLKEQQFPLRPEILHQAIADALDGKYTLLNEQDVAAVFQRYQQQKQDEQQAKIAQQAAKNRLDGQTFLEANAKRSGVKTTPSGLQYEVLQEGKGPKPSGPKSKVKVHYRGMLLDGKEFDSSYKRGQPAEFELDQVIKGWSEAVQLMSVGSKYKFYIPPDLAYGDREVGGGVIPPGSTLIFEVELLETNDQ